MSWSCPDCARTFAQRPTLHSCVPSDVQAALRDVQPVLLPVVHRLMALVDDWPDVRWEFASGSFMAKVPTTFLRVRPRSRDVQVTFMLDRVVDEFPVTEHIQQSARRVAHAVHVDDPAQVDGQLLNWLREAHALCRR